MFASVLKTVLPLLGAIGKLCTSICIRDLTTVLSSSWESPYRTNAVTCPFCHVISLVKTTINVFKWLVICIRVSPVTNFGYLWPHRWQNNDSIMTSSNGNLFCVLALCTGNSPVTGEFPSQRPVTRSFDVFFDLRLNTQLRLVIWDAIVLIMTSL